jgi:hypothetical protein
MARKAVNGFPEKSYYDNTRYLGVVATTDPLNEGLFKHLVNFDISDTGQSVKPRDGFLTTTLKGVNIISLSSETVIYKDNSLNDYLLFDIKNNKLYRADISAYNVENYYLPLKNEITNIDWTSLFLGVLIPQLTWMKAASLLVSLETLINTYRPYIQVIPETKVEHIYDENGVSRTLIKVLLSAPNQPVFEFVIQLRFNENANYFYIEGMPGLYDHPTLAASERNLAVSKSIIPEIFQRLYTSPAGADPRPDGHIDSLGNFVYIYDNDENYVNSFIYRNTNYNIKPFFSLNPAYYNLNNDVNVNDKWAYKFELFNTSTEISDSTKNVVFSTPWMKYENNTTKPTPVFGIQTNNFQDDTISLGNTERINNHYLGSNFVIFLIYKIPTNSTSELLNGVETQPVGLSTTARTDIQNIYNSWSQTIATIKDLKTLRSAVNVLSNTAFFYIYNLKTPPGSGAYKAFDESMQSEAESAINNYAFSTTAESTFNIFLTGPELIREIEANNVFKENYNIAFKMLPYVSKDTRTITSNITGFTSDARFFSAVPRYVNYNPNDGLVIGTFNFDIVGGQDIITNGNATLLTAGVSITGSGIQPGTVVVQVLTSTSLRMSKVATSSPQTVPLTFTSQLITPVNTRVQLTTTGQMFVQTASPEGNQYNTVGGILGGTRTFNQTSGSDTITTGSTIDLVTGQLITGTGIPSNTRIVRILTTTSLVMSNNATQTLVGNSLTFGADLSFSFIASPNNAYQDTRTNSFYRFQTAGSYGSFGFEAIDDLLSSRIQYRWFLATIANWGGATNYLATYPNFRRQINYFDRHDTGFFKYNFETGQYSIETSLSTLNYNFGGFPSFFTSYSTFANQIPYYSSTNPNGVIEAIIGTYIQDSITGVMYVRTGATPKAWIVAPIPLVIPAPPPFTKGSYYFDQRTSKTYLWENNTTGNGYFTEVGNYPFRLNLEDLEFFDKGITGIFYIRPYEDSELLNESAQPKTYEQLQTLKAAWSATSLRQTFNVTYGFDALTVTYIEKTLTKEPLEIAQSRNYIVFENAQLVVWYNNVLYISEPGKYYWFKATKRIEFGEEIIKVLQYKQLMLVFTTQHLYAVYRVETVSTQLNTTTNQIEQNVTGVAWLKQTVLYNLLVNKKYADVIQIFNQMVLFYSEDGQLIMIRPSNTIDDQTRFSIQFFNKAANDILLNYDQYINERLAAYNKDTRITKAQVKIKSLVSVNFIKILYYVPNVITYMLIYDVLNNRYYAYDSLTFTEVFDKFFIESGDLLVTKLNDKLFFTMPYVEQNVKDNHADIAFTNNFKKEGINCLVDTGNLNLNNHLHKRFRDLHVTFKNLNAGNILFNVETMIDEIIARPFYSAQLEVKDIGGVLYFVTVPKTTNNQLIELIDINQISETATDAVKYSLTNNLFENNNMLMDFSDYTSSKLLTHRTSILGLGKVFRIKLQFISKGSYKLQNFGIIYKERRV